MASIEEVSKYSAYSNVDMISCLILGNPFTLKFLILYVPLISETHSSLSW